VLNALKLKPIRAYFGGTKITSIKWHTQFPRQVFIGCKNSNLYHVCIGQTPVSHFIFFYCLLNIKWNLNQAQDSFGVIELYASITDLGVNEDTSRIAVACGSQILVVDELSSCRCCPAYSSASSSLPPYLAKPRTTVIQEVEKGSEGNDDETIYHMPLGVHFLDEFAIAAVYVDRVM